MSTATKYSDLVEKESLRLSTSFKSGKTRDYGWRKTQLQGLQRFLKKNLAQISECLRLDLGRCEFEVQGLEIMVIENDIKNALDNLATWMEPTYTPSQALMAPTISEYRYEPYGVCLLLAPFNYPVELTISPLVGIIAAGNCCLIKPSELTSNVASLLEKELPKYLDRDCFSVLCGGVELSTAVLANRWDHIFFTGSTRVGKIVLKAAAEHLTPCVLELGGKSPTIIDASATDLMLCARRILWGKMANAGQTCISPDYVFCHEKHYDEFIACAKKVLTSFAGEDPQKSPDFGRIVSKDHCLRLQRLIETSGGKVEVGGVVDVETRYVSPTILSGVSQESPVMKEEIFGPVLPVIRYRDLESVIRFIQSGESPLAMYIFAKDRKMVDRLCREVPSGGVVTNDIMFHFFNLHLPFGGVGHSGLGKYRGKYSFEAFSHRRCYLRRDDHSLLDIPARYPPYSDFNLKLMLFAGKHLPDIPPHPTLIRYGGMALTVLACAALWAHYISF